MRCVNLQGTWFKFDSILNINAISSLFVHDYIKNRGKGDVN